MSRISRFNEAYLKVVGESAFDEFTVVMSAQKGDDAIDDDLMKACAANNVECEFGEGFSPDEKTVTMTGSKAALRTVISQCWLANSTPLEYCEDNEPDESFCELYGLSC